MCRTFSCVFSPCVMYTNVCCCSQLLAAGEDVVGPLGVVRSSPPIHIHLEIPTVYRVVALHRHTPSVKAAFHDTDTDILADSLARTVGENVGVSFSLPPTGITSGNRACWTTQGCRRVGRVGVGVVECGLYSTQSQPLTPVTSQ